jgi:hypothetical protein
MPPALSTWRNQPRNIYTTVWPDPIPDMTPLTISPKVTDTDHYQANLMGVDTLLRF